MIGNTIKFDDERLRHLLQEEFGETAGMWDEAAIKRARAALYAYQSVAEFMEDTGWGRDNPEIQNEAYLTGNRICRFVDGQFFYLSRLMWEGMEGGSL